MHLRKTKMDKFQRVGYSTGKKYDRGYSDKGHPNTELVLYKYGDEFSKPSLDTVRDSKSGLPHFFQLHNILPFDYVNGFDPTLEPLRIIRAENLESIFFPNNEARIYLADSTKRGGTNSLKDPDAIVTLCRLKELGYNNYTLASTGDCGASFCHYGSKLGINIDLFIPEDCYSRWELLENEISEQGLINQDFITIHKKGKNMHDAFENSVAFAHKKKIPHDYFFNNQLRIEGSKTMHIELFEALGKSPDYYVQALGSGTGLFAMWKASYDLGLPCPQLIGVQPDGCSPMVRASRKMEEQTFANTYVMGIGLPKLGPAFPYLKDLSTEFISVHEGGIVNEKETIKTDLNLLKEAGIIDPGLEASLTVSGLKQISNKIIKKSMNEKRTLDVILGITGKMRKQDELLIKTSSF